jgi:hypothetical protein
MITSWVSLWRRWRCRCCSSGLWRRTDVSPEDGDSMFLRNIGIYLRVHTASESRRTASTRVSMPKMSWLHERNSTVTNKHVRKINRKRLILHAAINSCLRDVLLDKCLASQCWTDILKSVFMNMQSINKSSTVQ